MSTANEPVLPSYPEVTRLLEAVAGGDRKAASDLLPVVYEELRKLARVRMNAERPEHTLDPTALVHEAYMRLVGAHDRPNWDGRGHFFASAAEAMRRILVERARARAAQKRGGDRQRVELGEDPAVPSREFSDVIGVDELLKKLELKDARKAQIVTLRFFGGLSNEETATALGLSLTTVKNEWSFTRAWLHRELDAMKDREE
ncbi:MAG: sigma-70 family RNA polymerase sigma factor [Phycisphaerales bacterium]